MDDILLLEAVERYLKGEMNPEEKAFFEGLRKKDPEIDQASYPPPIRKNNIIFPIIVWSECRGHIDRNSRIDHDLIGIPCNKTLKWLIHYFNRVGDVNRGSGNRIITVNAAQV